MERHVRPNDEPQGGWVVTPGGSDSVEAHCTTQDDAVDQARHALREHDGGTLYVHSTDGSVREEHTTN